MNPNDISHAVYNAIFPYKVHHINAIHPCRLYRVLGFSDIFAPRSATMRGSTAESSFVSHIFSYLTQLR
jgi:hypothetical protein